MLTHGEEIMNWFSIDKFMPPVEEEGVATVQVLVTDGDHVAQAFYALDGSGGWYQTSKLSRGGDTWLPMEPTHWAFIPELPK